MVRKSMFICITQSDLSFQDSSDCWVDHSKGTRVEAGRLLRATVPAARHTLGAGVAHGANGQKDRR